MTQAVPLLVVEDEALVLIDLQDALEEGGYLVLAATDGPGALQLLDDRLAEVRALITDVDIGPGAITGWDIAQQAREVRPDLPVVYMTGASADQWASRGVPNSILLAKPFATAQLLTAVSQLINATTKIIPDQKE